MALRQRAVLDQHKQERREAILNAADALLARPEAALASVEEIARDAGLAKGTVYLYFKTREEVFLAVHERHMHAFFDTLDRLLDARGGATTPEQIVASYLASVRAHPTAMPLAGLCFAFERNVDFEVLLRFKAGFAARLEQRGQRLEALFAHLAPGEGVRLLCATYALSLGLWQLTHEDEHRRRLRQYEALRVFRRDYFEELEHALSVLWRGALPAAAGVRSARAPRVVKSKSRTSGESR